MTLKSSCMFYQMNAPQTKLLKENTGENFFDIGLDKDFFDMTL